MMLALFNSAGCSQVPLKTPIRSGIDTRFKIQKLNDFSQGTTSSGVSFYQTVLSQTLGSHCKMMPSDSRYSQMLTKRCGSVESIYRSMARFYFEPSAGELGTTITRARTGETNEIYFEDLPDSCLL